MIKLKVKSPNSRELIERPVQAITCQRNAMDYTIHYQAQDAETGVWLSFRKSDNPGVRLPTSRQFKKSGAGMGWSAEPIEV